MAGSSVELGFYPVEGRIDADSIEVEPLPDIRESIEAVKEEETIHKDWLYAPRQPQRDFLSEEVVELPYSARVFALPKTHRLSHPRADNEQHLEFLVWCLGFFTGMRLTSTEAGFLDATPIKPGELVDFVLIKCSLDDALRLSEAFWQQHKHDARNTKRVAGIIHALFLAQYPPFLPFERFTYLYTALDACFALTKAVHTPPRRLSHAARIEWMCQQFDMPVPDWASPQGSASEISLVRNDAIHEALFFEEPLGFSSYGGNVPQKKRRNIPHEMQHLTCRLLVALLGKPDCDYVKSPVTMRSRMPLTLV